MSNKAKDPFRTPSPKLEVERQPPPAPRPSRTRSSITVTNQRLEDANITPLNLTNRFERVQSSDSLSSTSSLMGGHYASHHHLLSLFSSDASSVDTEHSDSPLDIQGENETGSVHSEESNDSSHSGDSSDVESISDSPKRGFDEIDSFFATPNIDTTPTPTNEKDLLSYIHSNDDVSSIASTTSYASIPHIQPEPWAQRLRPRTHFAPVTYSLKYLTYYTVNSKRMV